QAADAHPETQEQAEKRNLDHRIPLPRAGRSEAEGARSRLRHGAATLGLFAEPASVAAPPWRKRNGDGFRSVSLLRPNAAVKIQKHRAKDLVQLHFFQSDCAFRLSDPALPSVTIFPCSFLELQAFCR